LDVADSAAAGATTGRAPAVDVAIDVKLMTHSFCFVDSAKVKREQSQPVPFLLNV
jgi:hypothetical protein